ncbi:MAG: WecB/TagA/CpsF family glycosyltransferase [Actinobacteria bacterium]|nr:WecB/TagA/CpsF family glycosyltransferase [Actinomycetota bacterium]
MAQVTAMTSGDQARGPTTEAEALRRLEFRVLGTRVHALSTAGALAWIDAWLQAGMGAHLATVNPEFVMHARQDPRFRALLEHTRLNLPDGMGVVWAGRLNGIGVPERVTGVDLIREIAALAVPRRWRLLLIGGRPGVADAAGRALQRDFPRLVPPVCAVGAPDPSGDADAGRLLAETRPHVVLVAYGAPAQEYWIARNVAGRFPAVAMGVGGAFDVLSGRVPRAPLPLRSTGLEWAFRLWHEPARWRRMRVLPEFAWLAVQEALARPAEP